MTNKQTQISTKQPMATDKIDPSPAKRLMNLGPIVSGINLASVVISLLVAAGVWMLGYVFTHYGFTAGVVVGLMPLAICIFWITLNNPAYALMGLFIVNFFIMGIARMVNDMPVGVILDAMIGYNLLLVVIQTIVGRVDWGRAKSGVTLASLIWLLFCIAMLANPHTYSVSAAMLAGRSMALYFVMIAILTQVIFDDFKYVKYIIGIWTVLTLMAVGKAMIQKYIGFSATELHWLYVEGGASTHLIQSGIRYFSFFSDAANFGGSMGLSMVVFSIASMYYRNPLIKTYLLAVAVMACYGMLISGTRSALAVPFTGYAVLILLSCNVRMIVGGTVVLISSFVFLNFTTIGQGNAVIRRARSVFNTEDKSFQVRLKNQQTLRQLMSDKPFGIGLGHAGVKAKKINPGSVFAHIPTDSWFVMIWVETGLIGLLIHILTLLYILSYGAYLVIVRLRHPQVRGITTALICGISGIIVMSYVNEVFGQFPNGVIIYMSAAFIFLAPRFEKELIAKESTK